MEKRIAYMRMVSKFLFGPTRHKISWSARTYASTASFFFSFYQAFDQQQQDLVDAASKALSYRQDIIEENIRLTYALQVTSFNQAIVPYPKILRTINFLICLLWSQHSVVINSFSLYLLFFCISSVSVVNCNILHIIIVLNEHPFWFMKQLDSVQKCLQNWFLFESLHYQDHSYLFYLDKLDMHE